MTKLKIQSFSITALSLLVIFLAWFGVVPGILALVVTAVLVVLPDFIPWLVDQRIFWSASLFIFNRRLIKYFEWMDKQDLSDDSELDFSNAPWVPKYIREYTVRLGTLLHTQRALLVKEQRKKDAQKKKPRKRRVAGHGDQIH